MTRLPTVLIVGGGATGTGIARDLALRGVEVMLVERNGLSGGASSRSHGLLHSGARYSEADRVGAKECIVENRILRSIAGECIRDTGGLFVQLAGDDAAYFDEKQAACEEIGIKMQRLNDRGCISRRGDEAGSTSGPGGCDRPGPGQTRRPRRGPPSSQRTRSRSRTARPTRAERRTFPRRT